MTETRFEIVSDRVAAAQILEAKGTYHAFFGAGLSVEAGVPTANQICRKIAMSQLRINGFGENADPDAPAVREWLLENLAWDRSDERYAKCIRTQYPNPGDRVDFFRRELTGVTPSFAHHGAAILMNEGILGRTCLTTNFDKLLEHAFAIHGNRECQALRTAGEIEFWRPEPDRCFCVKLHGDYDTHNVLNTSEETVRIDEALRDRSSELLLHQGLLVLGLAGYEKSVYSLFEDLTTGPYLKRGALARGLLWGVFVGPKPREPWDAATMRDAVRKAIAAAGVGPEITKLMSRMATGQARFAFFPVFGAGRFLMDLIELSRNRALIAEAEPFLDHEIRLRRVFSRANLSEARVDAHIRHLKHAKPKTAAIGESSRPVERAFATNRYKRQIWFAYGDIAGTAFLDHEDFRTHIRAVVSPDDTFLSVGGGVAVALAEKAGMRATLHDVSKFGPVPQGESRVTSAGNLPVHYIIHAATIKVSEEGYGVTSTDVRRTFRDVLQRASALGVSMLSVPLLGAGVAGLSPADSFRGLVEAYHDVSPDSVPALVAFVVYKEAQLARADARRILQGFISGEDATWSEDAWPLRTDT